MGWMRVLQELQQCSKWQQFFQSDTWDVALHNSIWLIVSCFSRTNDMIYLLTAIGLTPGGSITIHIYTQTIRRTTQWNNTQNGTYITISIHKRYLYKIKQKHTKLTIITKNTMPEVEKYGRLVIIGDRNTLAVECSPTQHPWILSVWLSKAWIKRSYFTRRASEFTNSF
jgi:hypothetical protein